MDAKDQLHPPSVEGLEVEPRDFIQSLEKGFAILRAFRPERPSLTLSEAANATGITRAAARRFLLTLTALGYLGRDKKSFWLKPKVLELGQLYLASQPWWDTAQAVIEETARRTSESCSLCILDGNEILYVSRVAVSRLISSNLTIGSRLPAYPTALGRVLLAQLAPDDLKRSLRETTCERFTPKTVTSKKELFAVIERARNDGYSLVDQELEMGLLGLAVPVRGSTREFAALGVSAHSGRVSKKQMIEHFLPLLRESAARIGINLTRVAARR